jgi:hypothetical protein
MVICWQLSYSARETSLRVEVRFRRSSNKNGIARAASNPGLRLAVRCQLSGDIGRRTEMKAFRVTLAGAMVLVAVTAAFGISVKSDYEKSFDFSQLRTFAFKADRAGNDPLRTNTIEAQRIQNALTAQLEANGFTPSERNPDFIVAFYSRSREKTQVESTGFGYGPLFGWGYGIPYRARWRWGFGPDIWTDNYTQGCVMVDIIDPKNNELVWRGVAKDTINGIGQSEKQANQIAKDLVKRYMKDAKKLDQDLDKKK